MKESKYYLFDKTLLENEIWLYLETHKTSQKDFAKKAGFKGVFVSKLKEQRLLTKEKKQSLQKLLNLDESLFYGVTFNSVEAECCEYRNGELVLVRDVEEFERRKREKVKKSTESKKKTKGKTEREVKYAQESMNYEEANDLMISRIIRAFPNSTIDDVVNRIFRNDAILKQTMFCRNEAEIYLYVKDYFKRKELKG